MTQGCGAPDQDKAVTGVDTSAETVISGTVTRAGEPVSAAYVRLLDGSGEFTAEVPTGESGAFRFFAAPGSWTLRVLSSAGQKEAVVAAERGVNEVSLELA